MVISVPPGSPADQPHQPPQAGLVVSIWARTGLGSGKVSGELRITSASRALLGTFKARLKLNGQQRAHLLQLDRQGAKTPTELAELFGVSRATIYREPKKAQEAAV
jgi:DNA-binding MarR family transcriptional regulator